MTSPPNAQQPFAVGIPNFGIQQDPARYVNSIGVNTSQWDVALDLYHQFVIAGTPNPARAQQLVCRTVMSPMHAKAMASILQQAVDQWEVKFGPLPPVDVLIYRPGAEGEQSDV